MQEGFRAGGEEFITMKQSDLIELEHENQDLRCALTWCLIQLKEMDHDCHNSPDSGCAWCHQFWEYASLVGMNQREFAQEEENKDESV